MTPAQDIKQSPGQLDRSVSHSWNQQQISTSPTANFSLPQHSLSSSFGTSLPQRGGATEKQLKPFNTQDVKILLLENVNKAGQEILKAQGYQVEALKTSLPEDQLIEKIR
jgi:D-3-phosphoglycerate dehydrogenase / 2-oxoglutarate reductase